MSLPLSASKLAARKLARNGGSGKMLAFFLDMTQEPSPIPLPTRREQPISRSFACRADCRTTISGPLSHLELRITVTRPPSSFCCATRCCSMTRIARIVAPNLLRQVTQRDRSGTIFFEPEDYRLYKLFLKKDTPDEHGPDDRSGCSLLGFLTAIRRHANVRQSPRNWLYLLQRRRAFRRAPRSF